MAFIFPPPEPPSVAISGSTDRIPVHRVFGVGRNYADDERERAEIRAANPAIFFDKPADSVVDSGTTVPYPMGTGKFVHEIELVAVIGREARDTGVRGALDCVWGYAAGLDLTRMDLMEAGRGDTMAKGFAHAAPVGKVTPVEICGHPDAAAKALRLSVNGEPRQEGTTAHYVRNVAEAISELSQLIVLRPGDLIFMGTCGGLGPLARGDTVAAEVEGVGAVEIAVAP